MKNMKIDTVITIMVLVVAVTASHMRLSGQIDTLKATNAIDHAYLKEEIGEIKLSISGNPLNNYADDKPIVKKRKKQYAGFDGMMVYEDGGIE